jgi:hypothetical protein
MERAHDIVVPPMEVTPLEHGRLSKPACTGLLGPCALSTLNAMKCVRRTGRQPLSEYPGPEPALRASGS